MEKLDAMIDRAIDYYSKGLVIPVDLERELLDAGIDVAYLRNAHSS